MEIREDLKTNPEYLNELIGVLNGSLTLANNRIKQLEQMVGNSDQSELIELQDKVEMLNRRFLPREKSPSIRQDLQKKIKKSFCLIMCHL